MYARSLKEIAAATTVSSTLIGRCVQKVTNSNLVYLDPVSATDFIPRFCANLSLTFDIERLAHYIASTTEDQDIAPGKSPLSVAAAAIYMASHASGFQLPQQQIAFVSGVGVNTLSQCYRLMRPKLIYCFQPKSDSFKLSLGNI